MTSNPVTKLVDKLMASPELLNAFSEEMYKNGIAFRKNVEHSPLPDPAQPSENIKTGVILDVETEGLEETDQVIELAMLKFTYTDEGIVELKDELMQLNDPGRPLSEDVSELTGWTDADLKNKKFDLEQIKIFLEGVNVAIAFKSSFDRPKVERFLPEVGFDRMNWACAFEEIDWAARGIRGSKSLEQIALHHGYVFNAHKATADIRTTAFMMNLDHPKFGRAFAEMLDHARSPQFLVTGQTVDHNGRKSPLISFDDKDKAKQDGWLFDQDGSICGTPKSWWKTVKGTQEDLSALSEFVVSLKGRHVDIECMRTTARRRFSAEKGAITVINTRDFAPAVEVSQDNNHEIDEQSCTAGAMSALLR